MIRQILRLLGVPNKKGRYTTSVIVNDTLSFRKNEPVTSLFLAVLTMPFHHLLSTFESYDMLVNPFRTREVRLKEPIRNFKFFFFYQENFDF